MQNGSIQTLSMITTADDNDVIVADIRFMIAACDLGWLLMAATRSGICAIMLGDSSIALDAVLRIQFPHARRTDGASDLTAWMTQVCAYIVRPRHRLELPLHVTGTVFQQQVWAMLQTIPPGSTASYAELATRLGKPRAVRAVARACAANLIAIAIPCHRVIRSDGTLGGYRWGKARKQVLLEREALLNTQRETHRAGQPCSPHPGTVLP